MLLLVSVAVLGLSVWRLQAQRSRLRDEIFAGETPGVIAAAPVVRTPKLEYEGPFAVAFSPPRNVTPGLVGLVIDGVVDPHDLTATLVDLAARGYVTIEVVEGRKKDWMLRVARRGDPDLLRDYELDFLNGIFAGRNEALMSEVVGTRPDVFRRAAEGLRVEAARQGWYHQVPDEPAKSNRWPIVLGVGGALFTLFVSVSVPALAAAAGFVAAGIVGSRVPRGRVPRTAVGTAVRVQSLGFKQYLATAEANQITFEEAADIFSRYLPYAMVFGVATHWAKVFKDVAVQAEAAGVPVMDDLTWLLAINAAADLGHLVFALDGLDGIVGGLGEFIGALDGLDGVSDGLGGVLEGVGDFVGGLFD